MEELKVLENGKITSLELRDQINLFRKQEGSRAELQHKTLLDIIRDEFEDEIDEQKILPIYYKDSMNREKPMFELTISQAKQVLVRESKFVRKAVINRLEYLERKLENVITEEQKLVLSIYNGGIDAVESTKKLVELKTKPLLDKIEEDKPLVEFANVCQTSNECIKIGEFVKLLPKEWNMGQNKLFAWFRFNGYLQKNNLPYQKYINDGTFEVKEGTFKYKNGDIGINMVTMITPKGQVKLTNKIKSSIN